MREIPSRGTWLGVQICFYDTMVYGFMFMHADGSGGKGMDRHGSEWRMKSRLAIVALLSVMLTSDKDCQPLSFND